MWLQHKKEFILTSYQKLKFAIAVFAVLTIVPNLLGTSKEAILLIAFISLFFFVPFAVSYAWHRWMRENKKNNHINTPTLEQYRKKNPHKCNGNGIKCNVCGSNKIRSYGLESREDTLRVHTCNQCETQLYKTGDWWCLVVGGLLLKSPTTSQICILVGKVGD